MADFGQGQLQEGGTRGRCSYRMLRGIGLGDWERDNNLLKVNVLCLPLAVAGPCCARSRPQAMRATAKNPSSGGAFPSSRFASSGSPARFSAWS